MVAEAVREFPMFIDGASVAASSGAWLEVRSPATRAVVGRVRPAPRPTSTEPSPPRARRSRTAAGAASTSRRVAILERWPR